MALHSIVEPLFNGVWGLVDNANECCGFTIWMEELVCLPLWLMWTP